jgi:hypothetical protein
MKTVKRSGFASDIQQLRQCGRVTQHSITTIATTRLNTTASTAVDDRHTRCRVQQSNKC